MSSSSTFIHSDPDDPSRALALLSNHADRDVPLPGHSRDNSELTATAHVADPAAYKEEVDLKGAHTGERGQDEGIGGRIGLVVVKVR